MGSSLLQAKRAFLKWHEQGKHRGRPSQSLKDMALALLEKHSAEFLSEELIVPPGTLRRWQESAKGQEEPTFVSLPLADPSSATSGQIRLHLPGGLSLEIRDQGASETAGLIAALLKELSSCSI